MPPTLAETPKSTPASPTISHQKFHPSQDVDTVIIFDWDDTLLASSFLSGKGYRLDSPPDACAEIEPQLKALEQSVVGVLTLALSYGQVHVITNAENGWVELSAQRFIPGVLPILNQIHVVSARSTYEAYYPDSPLKWKFCAFQDKLNFCFRNTNCKYRNVISFGDSHVEREAVRAVTRGSPNTRTKSVKFAERPSMEQLRRQIELVTNCFQYIHNHDGDLDLQLTVTVNNNPNGGYNGEEEGHNGTIDEMNEEHTHEHEHEHEEDDNNITSHLDDMEGHHVDEDIIGHDDDEEEEDHIHEDDSKMMQTSPEDDKQAETDDIIQHHHLLVDSSASCYEQVLGYDNLENDNNYENIHTAVSEPVEQSI